MRTVGNVAGSVDSDYHSFGSGRSTIGVLAWSSAIGSNISSDAFWAAGKIAEDSLFAVFQDCPIRVVVLTAVEFQCEALSDIASAHRLGLSTDIDFHRSGVNDNGNPPKHALTGGLQRR